MIQNIYAPFPLPLHLGFAIFATFFLLVQFYRRKYFYYLLLTIGIDLTLITHGTHNQKIIIALGIIEAILLIWIIVSMAKISRMKKKALKQQDKPENEHHELFNEAEDIIKRAFPDNEDEE